MPNQERMVKKLVGFRPEQLDLIQLYVEQRRKQDPGAKFSFNDAVRVLVYKGAAAMGLVKP